MKILNLAYPDKSILQYKITKFYSDIFSGEAGRAVLKDLKQKYYFQSSYVSGDPYGTVFREGQRNVVIDILTMLKLSQHPEIFEIAENEEIEI